MQGFISIDKPAGVSSFQATRTTARALGVDKAGHAGTLDPFATGVLPIAVGEATKAVRYLHLADKTYMAVIRFGLLTDTLDITGNIVEERSPPSLDGAAIEGTLVRFVGEIMQRPPLYSAIKSGGRRMYDLARSGDPVEAVPRKVLVKSISLVGLDAADATIEIRCGTGTYIRSLARDIGEALGTVATLATLTRTSYGPFLVESSCPPRNASLDRLVPILDAFPPFPRIVLPVEGEKTVRNGRKIDRTFFDALGVPCPDSHSRTVFTDSAGRLITVVLALPDGTFKTERVFNVEKS